MGAGSGSVSGGLGAMAQSLDVVSLVWSQNAGYVAFAISMVLLLMGAFRLANKNPDDNWSGIAMIVSAILLSSFVGYLMLGTETIFGAGVSVPSELIPAQYN